MLTDGLEWCGLLLWCFYQTLILTAPIHCRASIAEQVIHFSKSDEETNSSTSWMAWSRGHFNFSKPNKHMFKLKILKVMLFSFPFMVVFLERCWWERSEGGAKQAVWTKLIKWSLIQTFPGHQLRGIKEESEKARGVRDEARERSGRLN